ncbi:unnamed protein product [Cochlearia groenlandica]
MIQMDGGDRLRVTLLDRISTVETSLSSLTGITLETILTADKNRSPPQPPPHIAPPSRIQSNRTLLDVMQRDHRNDHDHGRDKTAWKTLREKLRLKRNANVWISSNPIPASNTPIPIRDNNESRRLGFLFTRNENTVQNSPESAEGRFRLGAVLAEERALSAREEETPPARMSLMELLEENEGQQMSLVSVDGKEEEGVSGGGVEEIRCCCVCMVRSKGAAFVPCGHMFCRFCSRELLVTRGNCPLCNTPISEILDLF